MQFDRRPIRLGRFVTIRGREAFRLLIRQLGLVVGFDEREVYVALLDGGDCLCGLLETVGTNADRVATAGDGFDGELSIRSSLSVPDIVDPDDSTGFADDR